MTKVTAKYAQGNREGREQLRMWKKEGILTDYLISDTVIALKALYDRLKPLAFTSPSIDYISRGN